ncbi:MAG: 50S ribosomal protein L4 [Rhodospirillaceae bacterium]|nr:50S ribosomal protein L4 [Rhodospirillaceae bacterium]
MKCNIINLDNKNVGSANLAKNIFGLEVREDILQRVVRWQLAKKQMGTHKTKTRGEISGTNKKPFKQKGTGRARQGSARAPQLRGGGKAFGPVVRSHAHSLPKKVRRLGLKTALSSKAKEGELIILDEATCAKGKTKVLVSQLKKMGWTSALLIGGETIEKQFFQASKNIVGLDVLPEQGVNTYDILRREKLILTQEALTMLEERLK